MGQSCLRKVMESLGANIGYTQSDELIVFVAPAKVIRGEQQPHLRSGRVTKLATVTASLCSVHFITELALMAISESSEGQDHDGKVEGEGHNRITDFERLSSVLQTLHNVVPHFDCRVGCYDSWEEAQALLLWRAYDCGVNGVSDAVYQSSCPGAKKVMGEHKCAKLKWLHEVAASLPLPTHQAYGTLLVRVKRVVEAVNGNPKAKETMVKVLRSVIDHVEEPVLKLFIEGHVFLKDEALGGASTDEGDAGVGQAQRLEKKLSGETLANLIEFSSSRHLRVRFVA